MSTIYLSCLNQISNYLKVPLKVSLNADKLPMCTLNNKQITGFVNIIIQITKIANAKLLGNTLEEQCEVKQWLEYCVTYASHCDTTHGANQVFQELNAVLESCTYLVNHYLTIADVAVFYMLHNAVEKMTYHQKENYLNVSRWFDNIQQNNTVRSKNCEVDFSTLFLTSVSVR